MRRHYDNLTGRVMDTAAIGAGLSSRTRRKQLILNCLNTLSLLAPDYNIVQSIEVENLGSFDSPTSSFLSNLVILLTKFVHHLARTKKLHSFFGVSLFLIQLFKNVLLHDSCNKDVRDSLPVALFFNPCDIYYRGYLKIIMSIFIALPSWQGYCESSLGSFDECRLRAKRPSTFSPSQPMFYFNVCLKASTH